MNNAQHLTVDETAMMFTQNVVFAFNADAKNLEGQGRDSDDDLNVIAQDQTPVPIEIRMSSNTDLFSTNREPTAPNNENKKVQPDGGETNTIIDETPSLPTIGQPALSMNLATQQLLLTTVAITPRWHPINRVITPLMDPSKK
jgi:hypothetical protein